MSDMRQISVLSPSFSKNAVLKEKVLKYFPNTKLNLDGKRFNQDELIEFIKDSDGVIVGLEVINKEVLKDCSKLKIVSKYGVGLNNIDIDECKLHDVAIGWSGGVNKLSVAEMTIGFMLMLCRNLFLTSNQLKNSFWNKSGGYQLSEKTIGIIGMGHIGKEVVRLLKPFNCKILVNDIIEQELYYQENGLVNCTKEYIFMNADIITLHTPYNKYTEAMVDRGIFEIMKSNAFIINTARGGIIDEDALKFALSEGLIAGAAIDTYVHEPPVDKDLLSLENLVCTPHIGGNSIEAVEAMGISAIEHLKGFFSR